MKLSELYFTKDEAQNISLEYLNGIGADGYDPNETLDQFLEFSKVNYSNNAAEINKELKRCGLKPLKIQLNFKDEVGMCFRVNSEWFIRKGYGYECSYYKSAVFANRPIYQGENQDKDYYTTYELIELCDGNKKIAKLLWHDLEGQMPETLLEDLDIHDINKNKMAKDYKGIISAIRSGRLNCDKHADGMPFRWYGRELVITPYFVSYGQGGYDIEDTSLNTYLQYDFDVRPKFEVLDKYSNTVYSEED